MPGDFGVRASESQAGTYSLSVRMSAPANPSSLPVKHFRIRNVNGRWNLSTKSQTSDTYASIPELIAFYQSQGEFSGVRLIRPLLKGGSAAPPAAAAAPAPAAVGGGSTRCSKCGFIGGPGDQFCGECGGKMFPMAAAPAPAAPAGKNCTKCGHANLAGNQFIQVTHQLIMLLQLLVSVNHAVMGCKSSSKARSQICTHAQCDQCVIITQQCPLLLLSSFIKLELLNP